MTKVHEEVAAVAARLHDGPVFGLMGDANLKFVTLMRHRHGMAYHGARHEPGAVAMADGWARATGRVGLCSVTQGPGLTNTVTAMVESRKAGTPVVLLVGDTPVRSSGLNQDIDQRRMIESLDIRYVDIDSDRYVSEKLIDAFGWAGRELRPVVVGIRTDVQDLEARPSNRVEPAGSAVSVRSPTAEDVDALLDWSRPPNGRSCSRGAAPCAPVRGRSLSALAQRIGAVTATSVQAKSLFDDEFCVGIAGGFASPVAVDVLAEADLVLAFGCSLTPWTMRMGTLAPKATIVQCDADAAALGARYAIDRGIHADALATADALLSKLPAGSPLPRYRIEEVGSRLAGVRAEPVAPLPAIPTGRLDGRAVVRRLEQVLPREKTVVVDSGHFMGHPAMHLSVPNPARFVFSQDFQAMGLGLAGGIGAAVAAPDALTVVVIGDGGLMMSLGELDTAVRVRLPMLVVVMNDAAYGAEYHLLDRFGLPVEDSCFPDSDFAAIARSLGARGATVACDSDLDAVADWLAAPDRPLIVDCKIEPCAMAPWFREVFALMEAQNRR
ncbi:thiamine pyrophosphate-binding protein [Pseudonocardia adelaidensis]|uniref:Thiamine pyrophosphate-binding protein n=1 Tax=Pseudonocardia adelaidensis TaxID=648754 RepID=A0ABP9PA41_9PSEU